MKIFCFISSMIGGFVITLAIRMIMLSGASNSPAPIPVSLIENESFRLPSTATSGVKPYQIELHWGGFYTYKVGDSYRIFRLIDLDGDSYHIMNFDETFEQIPSITEVRFLIPHIEHVAGSSLDFLGNKPVFLGSKQFIPDDLVAINAYRQKQGMNERKVHSLMKRTLALSSEEPFESLLVFKNGKLKFNQPL